jgi:hypothetical protein
VASPVASSSSRSPPARLSPPLQYPSRAHSPDPGYRDTRSPPGMRHDSPTGIAAMGGMQLPESPERHMSQSDWESYPKILPRNSATHPLHRSDSNATVVSPIQRLACSGVQGD